MERGERGRKEEIFHKENSGIGVLTLGGHELLYLGRSIPHLLYAIRGEACARLAL